MIFHNRHCPLILFSIIMGLYLLSMPIANAIDWTTYTDMNSASDLLYSRGLIWGCAPGGAFAFYPSGSVAMKLTNIDGLHGLELNTVEADSAGDLWFGAVNGTLNKFDSEGNFLTYYFIFERQDIIDVPLAIFDLASDGDWMWIAREKGLSKFSIYNNGGEIKENIEHMGPFTRLDVKAVCIDSDRVWFGTEQGIGYADKNSDFLPDGSIWTVFYEDSARGLGDFDIHSIISYDNFVYAATDSGVYYYDETINPAVWSLSGLGGLVVNKLEVGGDTLFAATDNGPFYYSGGVWQQYNPDGYPGGKLNDIAYVRDLGLWVAFGDGGLATYYGNWEMIYIPGPRGQDYGNIAVRNDTLWALSYGIRDQPGTAVNYFDGVNWRNFTAENSGMTSDVFYSVTIDNNSNAWIGLWGQGVDMFNPYDSSWTNYNNNNSPLIGLGSNEGYVVGTGLAVDDENNIWMGIYLAEDPHAVFVLSPDSTWDEIQLSDNGLQSNTFLRIKIRGHKALFSTEQGFDLLDYGTDIQDKTDDSWIHFDKSDGLYSSTILDSDIDESGYIWIGTEGGLYFYDPEFDWLDSLSLPFGYGPAVKAIEIDGLGNKWIGTGSGLLKLSPDNDSWTAYTTENSYLVNDNVLSLNMEQSSGLLWIGTGGGISRFDTGFEKPSGNLSQIGVYPNPAGPRFSDKVYFSRVPYGAKISIYNIAGEKIIEFTGGTKGGTTSWDYRNSSGKSCAGGVYIYYITTADNEFSSTGKFVLIK